MRGGDRDGALGEQVISIVLEDVKKAFDRVKAVDGVSVDILTGEFFVVLGASGCGKSTLLRLIAGLETLDAGAIRLDGRIVAGPELHVAPEARQVGVVFQSYALWPHMSVLRNVGFPVEARGARRAEADRVARQALAAVGLAELESRSPAALSGGQRQRVALARCLAGESRTLLLDEPLANLDPHLRAAMELEIKRVHAASGATSLYITHDQREAMALADRIAVMEQGKFLQVGSPQELYEQPNCEQVARFIGRGALLSGEVLGTGDGAARVRIGAATVTVPGANGLADGTARVFVRPQQVRLVEAGREEAIAGIVGDVSYRGGLWEAAVSAEGIEEPLPVESRSRLVAGERVRVVIESGWLLPDRAAGLERAA